MPGGEPDLSGVWNKTPERDTLGLGVLASGERTRPFTPEGQRRYADRVNQTNPDLWCWHPGVPRLDNDPYPMEIVQRPGEVVVLYEWNHNFRVIPTDGRPHPADLPKTFNGHSVGRWEGDTLVVDVVGFNDKTWLDDHGNQHTDELHIEERFTRTAYDRLEFQYTATDAALYTRPWSSRKRVWALMPAGSRLLEYSCTMNNLALERVDPGPHDLGEPDVLDTRE